MLLAVSEHNDCGYCKAAHSAIASMQEVPQPVIQSVVEGRPIVDP